jgi:uncharacterized membrane protein YjgN (DUF898 family)
VTESASSRSTSTPPVDQATQAPISTKPLVSDRTRRTTVIVSAIVAVVVLAVLIALGYLMYTSYDRAAVRGIVPGTVRLRDMAFVVMALETLVLMVLVLIVIVLLLVVVVLIYDRVIPILEQLNKSMNTVSETLQNVRGTTTFVSERVVSPFIEASSYASGIARIVKGVLDLWPKRGKAGRVQETSAHKE